MSYGVVNTLEFHLWFFHDCWLWNEKCVLQESEKQQRGDNLHCLLLFVLPRVRWESSLYLRVCRENLEQWMPTPSYFLYTGHNQHLEILQLSVDVVNKLMFPSLVQEGAHGVYCVHLCAVLHIPQQVVKLLITRFMAMHSCTWLGGSQMQCGLCHLYVWEWPHGTSMDSYTKQRCPIL